MSDPPNSLRKIYGRGLYDGLRKAGIENPGEFMNAIKMQEAEKALNGIAKKVYDTIPIQASWRLHEIMKELSRSGSTPDIKVVQGCLSMIKEKGLIKETQTGYFQRLPIRSVEKPSGSVRELFKDILEEKDMKPLVKKPQEPLDKIAAIGRQLREFSVSAKQIADEIDTVAIEVEERIQKTQKENESLLQLKQLLKSIGQ